MKPARLLPALALLPLSLPALGFHDGLDEEIRKLSEAIARSPEAELYLARAELFLAHEDPEEAASDWWAAHALAPDHPGLASVAARIEALREQRGAHRPIAVGRPRNSPSSSTVILPAGSVWRYLDDGSNQGSAWRALGFDDSGWASGPAQLGYGDGDEATVVGYGGNASNKYVTTYFRVGFSLPNPALYRTLELRLLRDDGALVYLNGSEIVRTNMPGTSIDSSTLASAAIAGEGEDAFYSFYFDPSDFVAGTNVLAVEIHQSDVASSDISFDLELIGHEQDLLVRGPYLQQGTDHSLIVRWRTAPATDSRVWYGTDVGQQTSVVDEGALTKEHELVLSGLAADQAYYYSVGTTAGTLFAGGDTEHGFTTSPAAGASRPTRIWVVGDSGTANASARAVRDAYVNLAGNATTHFWMMLGDNAYETGGEEEYQRAVFDTYDRMLAQSVVWATRGNHEKSQAVYEGAFSLPRAGEAGGVPSGTEAYYSFDYGNLHFVCLDSFGSDRSTGGPMYAWLASDLAATQAEWLIAYWHHPPYTKGTHDSDTESDLIDMRQNFLPLLEAHGVDLVLCGHSHVYERSYLIDGHYGFSASFDDSMKKDGGDGRPGGDGAYDKLEGPHRGTVYVVAGSSGQTGSGPLDHPAMVHAISALGSLVIDVDRGRLDLRFLRSTGQVWDSFTLLSEEWFGTYCAPAPHSEGCIATLSWSGTPSYSSGQPFTIDATSVIRNQFGILFYGHGPANAPFFGTKRCVANPITRTPPRTSGNGVFPCDGSLHYDFNALIQSGTDASLVPGARVYAQYWFRDPMGPTGSATSEAIQFTIEP